MAKVYIAYQMNDSDYVRDLAGLLEQHGHNVFFSGGNIRPGQMWQSELSEALRSADALVAIVSRSSSDSKWLFTEAGAALGYFRERGRPLVIPVLIEDVDIPAPLSSVQALFAAGKDIGIVAEELDHALDSQIGQIKAREDTRREFQQKVEQTAATYIKAQLQNLQQRQQAYRRIAYSWYVFALLSLIGGLAFGVWRAATIHSTQPTWESFAQLALVTVLIVGVLGALSRFAFLLGKAFMVESLRNADRSHAISFGEFYLNAYGDKAEWSEVKEAFQHWNIDKGSSFKDQDAKDVDPQILQTALDIAKAMAGVKGK
jgi:hypothetical protein